MSKSNSKKAYEKYLNEIGKSLSEEEFIIGGKQRSCWKPYGYLMRKYDNIAFEVGYNDWKRENNGKL